MKWQWLSHSCQIRSWGWEVILISPRWTAPNWLSSFCGIAHFHGDFCSYCTKGNLLTWPLVDKAIIILEACQYVLLVDRTSTWLNSLPNGFRKVRPFSYEEATLYTAKLQNEKGASKKRCAGVGQGWCPYCITENQVKHVLLLFQNGDSCQRLLAFRITNSINTMHLFLRKSCTLRINTSLSRFPWQLP